MESIPTPLEGLLIIRPEVYEDNRGYFYESYNKEALVDAGLHAEFVQDNQSMSQTGVLRGLHFQNPPFQQGKLVRVITGAVLDVAVDIRKDSPTYGQHFPIELTEQNKTMMWIPPGFAHGFLTRKDNTIFAYKCTQAYNKEAEDVILWNDPGLDIDWGIADPIVSEKDSNAQKFAGFNSLFLPHAFQ